MHNAQCGTHFSHSAVSDSCPFPFAPRPLSTQNCWTDICGVHWRVSLWTVCTATCGNYGFQSRRVDCVHIRTNKPVLEHYCSWRPRPVNWQRCNITPCENSTFMSKGVGVREGVSLRVFPVKSCLQMQCWASQLSFLENLQPECMQNTASKAQHLGGRAWCPLWFVGSGAATRVASPC